MSGLYHSLDLSWYNLKIEDSFFLEGWIVSEDKEIKGLTVFDQAGRELPCEVEWKARPDLKEARRDLHVPETPGFHIKIPGASGWIRELKRLDLAVLSDGGRETFASVDAAAVRKAIADSTIIYEVDVLQLLETRLVVQGWFIDQRGRNEIRVKDAKGNDIPCEMYRTVREDACARYAEYVEGKSNIGFTVKIPVDEIHTRYVRVCFWSRQVYREYRVDMKELKRRETRTGRLYNALRPGKFSENMEYIREHDLASFVDQVKKSVSQEYSGYSLWVKKHRPDKEEVRWQRSSAFSYCPKISIVIPLYHTPLKYLRRILDSIREQTYTNWELCLADGSTENRVEKYIRSHYGRDKRIKYRRLKENRGISENTNAALAMASGDYIMLSDHDDIVEQGALFEIVAALNRDRNLDIIYTDEDKITMDGRSYFEPNFKTDFNPFMLECNNYICHIFVVRSSIMKKIGGFRKEYDGAQDFDLILRCWEETEAERICHIPKILYHWRSHPDSTATNPESKRYAYEAGANALNAHFRRIGVDAEAEITENLGIYRIRRKVQEHPLVSIIIPNKDHVEDLEKCLASVAEKTTYDNYEILIVENNSTEKETFAYYDKLTERYSRCRLLTWEREFNYAAINNFAAEDAAGEYLLFLNNDVELITENWLEEFLGICQLPQVGIVGARLYFPDETIQHAGVIIGLGGVAGHIFSGVSRYEPGYMGRAVMPQNLSAVTAACMMMKRSVFQEVGGFDEDFRVAFNDVDLCMKTTSAGYQVVLNPYVQLYHYESKSRGQENTGDKQSRFYSEVYRFETKWPEILEKGDPYYNLNLSLKDGNCGLRD